MLLTAAEGDEPNLPSLTMRMVFVRVPTRSTAFKLGVPTRTTALGVLTRPTGLGIPTRTTELGVPPRPTGLAAPDPQTKDTLAWGKLSHRARGLR